MSGASVASSCGRVRVRRGSDEERERATRPDGDLTHRAREVLAALERLTERDGYAPSLRELGDEVGLRSASSVLAHMHALEDARLIETRARPPPRRTRGEPRCVTARTCDACTSGRKMT
jgi:DNA-binding MarR family transcriptional regulator